MNNQVLRGVLDNNVIVSAALLAGVPRQAFDKLLDNGTILVSLPVLLELAEVLNREKVVEKRLADSITKAQTEKLPLAA